MEHSNQQITQKISLPIKTKITAWWLVVLGIFFLAYQVSILYPVYKVGSEYGFSFPFFGVFPPVFLNTLILILPGVFLIKKKKAAWIFAVAVLAFIFISSLFSLGMRVFHKDFSLTGGLIIFLTAFPLVLLIFDRKNFFKIAK